MRAVFFLYDYNWGAPGPVRWFDDALTLHLFYFLVDNRLHCRVPGPVALFNGLHTGFYSDVV